MCMVLHLVPSENVLITSQPMQAQHATLTFMLTVTLTCSLDRQDIVRTPPRLASVSAKTDCKTNFCACGYTCVHDVIASASFPIAYHYMQLVKGSE